MLGKSSAKVDKQTCLLVGVQFTQLFGAESLLIPTCVEKVRYKNYLYLYLPQKYLPNNHDSSN